MWVAVDNVHIPQDGEIPTSDSLDIKPVDYFADDGKKFTACPALVNCFVATAPSDRHYDTRIPGMDKSKPSDWDWKIIYYPDEESANRAQQESEKTIRESRQREERGEVQRNQRQLLEERQGKNRARIKELKQVISWHPFLNEFSDSGYQEPRELTEEHLESTSKKLEELEEVAEERKRINNEYEELRNQIDGYISQLQFDIQEEIEKTREEIKAGVPGAHYKDEHEESLKTLREQFEFNIPDIDRLMTNKEVEGVIVKLSEMISLLDELKDSLDIDTARPIRTATITEIVPSLGLETEMAEEEMLSLEEIKSSRIICDQIKSDLEMLVNENFTISTGAKKKDRKKIENQIGAIDKKQNELSRLLKGLDDRGEKSVVIKESVLKLAQDVKKIVENLGELYGYAKNWLDTYGSIKKQLPDFEETAEYFSELDEALQGQFHEQLLDGIKKGEIDTDNAEEKTSQIAGDLL